MGNLPSFFDQNSALFIPKATWSTEDIPDLTGKVVIVTGGNAGSLKSCLS